MDLPVHIAAGALAGNVILYVESKFTTIPRDQWYSIKLGAACFLWGVLTHLFLDALPHYNWLFKLDVFRPLPFYWRYPQFITSLPVLLITFYLLRDYWTMAVIAIFGAVYPDIEKLLYLDAKLPGELVMFLWHSCQLSGTPWEHAHKHLLIVVEIGLFTLIMTGLFWIACYRKQKQNEVWQIFVYDH